MRIAICGIHIECSTFSPHPTQAEDFVVTRGDDLLARYDWLGSDWARDIEWIPILHARALPGGPVVREAFEQWQGEICQKLREIGPIDGLLFDIHGAMSVVGLDDAEGQLISAIRNVIGAGPLVSTPMDLHGNVSPTLFAGCDLLTCYRTAPHIDVWETRERAAHNLIDALRRGIRPAKSLVHVPVLLPGEMTSTRIEPARGLYARVAPTAEAPGVIDAAIWIGYAWADEPRCKAAIVVTGEDSAICQRHASELAAAFWSKADEFVFVAPTGTFTECVTTALESADRPFFISDSGDNPGAGGADDVTYALAELLQVSQISSGEVSAIYASLVDPEAVRVAVAAGVGATVEVTVGGKYDPREPGPIPLSGTVGAIGRNDTGGTCVTVVCGGLTVILTEHRMQYSELGYFTALGLDVATTDIVVVKIGYLEPELYEAARGWLLALTPGGVDQDLVRLGHHRIDRPMVPFDSGFTPALTPISCEAETL